MGFFKRLFSADYRAAVAAEAAGDLELAAERYALAGYHDAAARMHLSRAERATSDNDQIEALRDALHWAPDDSDVRKQTTKALGAALLSRARAEGIATHRDRERVKEAARLLEEAEAWKAAGEAWESIDEDQEAARAYGEGGLVAELERTLARETERNSKERRLRTSFENYKVAYQSGDRDAARDALRDCIEIADQKGDYRHLLDDLESRLITGGHIALRRRNGTRIVACARSPIMIGRDALCDLMLRSGGVSRRHAEIDVGGPNEDPRFMLRDSDSRNGTLIGGMPISGAVPLADSGSFALGEVYELDYVVAGTPPTLTLRITRGLDQGSVLRAAGESEPIRLTDDGAELPIHITFRDGRPFLVPDHEHVDLVLNDKPASHGVTQLIHGDQITIAGLEIEVV